MPITNQLAQYKVVPVIVVDYARDILPLGELLVNNGLPVAEITLRSDTAVEAIELLREHQPDMLIGAGTVLTTEQVDVAIEAGADFIVSPGFNPTVVSYCLENNIAIIPGVNNPRTIEQARELGIKTLKFFPAEATGGVSKLQSLIAPYTDVQFMPTGGINKDNINKYLDIDRVFACGGSWMVEKSLLRKNKWADINLMIKDIVSMTH